MSKKRVHEKQTQEDYDPLEITVEKFRGKRVALLELLSVIETTVKSVPKNPNFVFKCELTEETFDPEAKYLTDDPKCDKCNTSLDYCEDEGNKSWWECPNCGNIENEKEW